MATQNTIPNDNIFSGLKVVDFSSFVAGPGAAVILSDFGADVIKVEPPKGELWRIGNKIPPQPQSKYPYMWHLNNRNKRGVALDLKSPAAAQVIERLAKWSDVFIVNTPHPAREKLKLSYDDVVKFNSQLIYADITGYGDDGPDAVLPGFDITAYWSRSGLLSLLRDAGAPPTWPFAGTGDAPSGVGLFAAIVTALYRRERTRKGSYVTTSLLAAGVWSAGVAIQAALAGAKFAPQHDRKNPANAAMNVYKSSDNIWFVIVTTPDKIPALATGIGRADLLKDPRFVDPAKLATNMSQLTAIIDETFSSQPMVHWREVFDKAHIPYGLVRDPNDVVKDPQLQANNIVVPLEGAGENLNLTISSPIQVHGVAKVPARRAPDLGEHSEEILQELGFDAKQIEGFFTNGVACGRWDEAVMGGAPMNELLTERRGSILQVTLNRPAKKNAMTSSMYIAMAVIFENSAKDDEIRVVLWNAVGDAFCAGNDMEDFLKNPPGAGESPQARLGNALVNFDKPLVAAVQGAAIGGGTTLLSHCDFVYAAESAKFQLPFFNLGLVPEFGSSWSLPARAGHLRAAELILLGLPFDARHAAEIGFVTSVVPDDALLATVTETAETLAAKPPVALQNCKQLMKRFPRGQMIEAMKAENEEFAARVRSPEAKQALTSFLTKRRPVLT